MTLGHLYHIYTIAVKSPEGITFTKPRQRVPASALPSPWRRFSCFRRRASVFGARGRARARWRTVGEDKSNDYSLCMFIYAKCMLQTFFLLFSTRLTLPLQGPRSRS